MAMTSCPGCGLPRAADLIGRAPCPICGSDGTPPPPAEAAPPPAPVAAPAPVPAAAGSSRFALGFLCGLVLGAGVGVGGAVVAMARGSPAPPPAVDPPAPPPAPTPSPATRPSPPTAPAPPPEAKTDPPAPPNPFRPGGPVPLFFDNPDGEVRAVVSPGGHQIYSGKVRRLVVPGLFNGATLDASKLVADEVEVLGPIAGGSKLLARAPAGTVTCRAAVEGGSVVEVTGRTVAFAAVISGANTRATVTLTAPGRLSFAAVGGGGRLEYRKADPADPTPDVRRGLVVGSGTVAELP